MTQRSIEAVRPEGWTPAYSAWRHGGWYVINVRYPSGAVGCVSRNYADRKWRIVGENTTPGSPGDRVFPSRDAAARAERAYTQLLAGGGGRFCAVRQARTRVIGSRLMTREEAEREVSVWRDEIGPAVVADATDALMRAVRAYDQAVLAPLLAAGYAS
jgi:hypothetical protein